MAVAVLCMAQGPEGKIGPTVVMAFPQSHLANRQQPRSCARAVAQLPVGVPSDARVCLCTCVCIVPRWPVYLCPSLDVRLHACLQEGLPALADPQVAAHLGSDVRLSLSPNAVPGSSLQSKVWWLVALSQV